MAKIRDRTEDFKDAVRQSAMSLGYNEVRSPLYILILCTFLNLCRAQKRSIWQDMHMSILYLLAIILVTAVVMWMPSTVQAGGYHVIFYNTQAVGKISFHQGSTKNGTLIT